MTAGRRLFVPVGEQTTAVSPTLVPTSESIVITGEVFADDASSSSSSPPPRGDPARREPMPPPRGTSLTPGKRVVVPGGEETPQLLTPVETDNLSVNLDSSTVQGEPSTAGGTGQSPPTGRKIHHSRSKGKLKPSEIDEKFENLRRNDSKGVKVTPKDYQRRVI